LKVIPYIDDEKCIGCGICVEVCPTRVFKLSSKKAVVMRPEVCNGCALCVENCPVDAIELKWIDL